MTDSQKLGELYTAIGLLQEAVCKIEEGYPIDSPVIQSKISRVHTLSSQCLKSVQLFPIFDGRSHEASH